MKAPLAAWPASQNCDPAATSVAAAGKGAESSRGAACCPTGKRLEQELMTLMMSGDKGIPAFPESDNLFKWVRTIHGAAGTNPTWIHACCRPQSF
uniref:UBC core domain-containing protein n=1 Tax=Cebus imitator TaxID=2715852 RepID=A0A2K5QCK3_CEBIM